MDLRYHQKQCIDNIKIHFDTSNDSKALIKMFCGSGLYSQRLVETKEKKFCHISLSIGIH
jgi:hypothetical protein